MADRNPRSAEAGDSSRSSTSSGKRSTAPDSSSASTREAKAPSKASSKTPAGRSSKSGQANLEERMDGLLGWMTEMERRQGRITYFGAAAVVLAIGAAVLAILLALFTEADAVTEEDFQDLQEKVSGTTEQELKGLSETIGSLDQRIEAQERQLRQGGEQVAAVRSELQALQGELRTLRVAAQRVLQQLPG